MSKDAQIQNVDTRGARTHTYVKAKKQETSEASVKRILKQNKY